MTHEKSKILEAEIWQMVLNHVQDITEMKPDMNALLLLIGMREYGVIPDLGTFSKEEKVRLMDIAMCKLMSYQGYFTLVGKDENEWPVWEQNNALPSTSSFEQETVLRKNITHYFIQEKIIKL